MATVPGGAALRARRLDAGNRCTPVAADGGGRCGRCPRPVEVTVFLYADRDSARRSRRRAGARDRRLAARAHRAHRARTRAGDFSASSSIRIAIRSAPRRRCRRYGIGAYEMGQGAVVFTSGARSKVVTWEDLVEPELDADGEAGPAMRAWRGEAAFAVGAAHRHQRRSAAHLLLGGPRRARHRVAGRRRLRDVRGRAAPRRRRGARARTAWATPPRPAAACWWWPSRRRRCRRPSSRRCVASSTAAGALLVMLGPVFAPTARAFARVGLEAFAAEFGVRMGDNLVVDPSRASDVEGPTVWAAGPASYRAASAHDALRRPADLLAAHARGGAASSRPVPGSPSPRWCSTSAGRVGRDRPRDHPRRRGPGVRRAPAIARGRSASRSPSSARRRIRRGWCSWAPGGWS